MTDKQKEASILYDIQHNTSEFNIGFHLRNFASKVIYAIFAFQPYREQTERTIEAYKGNNDPAFVEMAIAESLRVMSEQYLEAGMGTAEDMYEDEQGEEQ